MVYKRVKRGSESGPGKKGGPNDKAKFKQRNKIGEATAKRMQDRLGKLRKADKDDEEIKSNESDAYVDIEPDNPKMTKRNELLNDPFL